MSQSKESPSPHEDAMPATSDFVKKLYKMLEDPAFQSVVSWGPQGDCFVVKDMNEFTKSILPRMFKHSNFASFVRQLNKYDFHKVKNTDESQFGEHSWTFRHPDFHADRRDALENIKRKVPAQRKAAQAAAQAQAQAQATAAALSVLPSLASTTPSLLPNTSGSMQSQIQIEQLQLEVRRLKEEGDDLRTRIRTLERSYESVLVEMVGFQRGMAQQDGLMQSLLSYFLGSENGRLKNTNPSSLLNPQSTPSASILPSSSLNLSSLPPQQHQQQQQQQHHSQSQASTSLSQQSTDSNIYFNRFSGPSSLDASSSSSRNRTNASTATAGGAGSGSMAAAAMAYETPMDVGRASLIQISELSRRAATATNNTHTWNGDAATAAAATTTTSWNNNDTASSSPLPTQTLPSSSSSSNNASFPSWMVNGLTRAEALAKIEEIYRSRTVAGSLSGNPSGSQWNTSSSSSSGGQQQQQQRQESDVVDKYMSETAAQQGQSQPQRIGSSSSPSSLWNVNEGGGLPKALVHEGLQVYTVGQLMPRSVTEDANSWGYNPSSSSGAAPYAGGFSSGSNQGTTSQDKGFAESSSSSKPDGSSNRQFVAPESTGSDDDDDEERVMPSPMNDSFSGKQSSNSAPSSSSSTGPSSSSSSSGALVSAATSTSLSKGKRSNNKLRVRRSTFVPGWAVPPRVLLVDDDIVSRKLGSKFLQVFGCTIDLAVDGVSAVNKMNLEKYDLVLMDIVMPKLDGVSATSLIRQFDHMTPIISMTSNSKPNEIMTYYSSGMNDILPKPFTKDGLFDMLEKHLMHLKAIQRMNQSTRSIGIPPLSDQHFEQAVTAGAASLTHSSQFQQSQNNLMPTPPSSSSPSQSNPSQSNTSPSSSPSQTAVSMMSYGTTTTAAHNSYSSYLGQQQSQQQAQDAEDDVRVVNPLSGMGLTDEQYNMILQNIVNGDGFMNGVAEPSSGGVTASSSSTSSPSQQYQSQMGISMGMTFGPNNSGGKRGYEDAGFSGSNGREKRSRFEVIE